MTVTVVVTMILCLGSTLILGPELLDLLFGLLAKADPGSRMATWILSIFIVATFVCCLIGNKGNILKKKPFWIFQSIALSMVVIFITHPLWQNLSKLWKEVLVQSAGIFKKMDLIGIMVLIFAFGIICGLRAKKGRQYQDEDEETDEKID